MRANVVPQVAVNNYMNLIYEARLGSALQYFTVSGLSGNDNTFYDIVLFAKNGSASAALSYYMAPNNDRDPVYGSQLVKGADSTPSADASTNLTGFVVGGISAQNAYSLSHTLLYSKYSASERLAITTIGKTNAATGTTMQNMLVRGMSWNITAGEITSLTFNCDVANGFGAGSYIAIYGKGVA